MLRRLAVPLAGLLLLSGLAAAASPAAAAEGPLNSVTMFSDPGDYIGQGVPRLFDDRNAEFVVWRNRTVTTVSVDAEGHENDFDFDIAAPDGTPLARGLYDRAQRTAFRDAGRPGIDVHGSGRGCNAISGRFEIRDIAFDAAGAVSRLHLLYEQHCEGRVPALFGEIRIQRSAGAGVVAEPSSVTWPDTHPMTTRTMVPVTLRAVGAGPTRVSSVRVTGSQANHFAVSSDQCTGAVLVAGESCEVLVRFVPRAAGPRTAVLTTTDSAGRTQRVQLDGAGVTGRTSWSMRGEAGDWISQGRAYSYTPATGVISATGSRSHIRAAVQGTNGDWFTADFTPGDGRVLAVGTYTATRYPFNGRGPGLSVGGNGRGCNRLTGYVTISQVTFSPVDGSLERLLVDFVQRCDGSTAVLRGSIAYRASSDVTGPAGVTRVTTASVPGGIRLSWTNPSTGWARTVVRRLDGSVPPGGPTTAHAAYTGTLTSVTVTGLPTGSRQAFSLWTVDPVGNVGRQVTVSATAG